MANNIKDIVVVLYEAPDKGGGQIKGVEKYPKIYHTDHIIIGDGEEKISEYPVQKSNIPEFDEKNIVLKTFRDTNKRTEEAYDNL